MIMKPDNDKKISKFFPAGSETPRLSPRDLSDPKELESQLKSFKPQPGSEKNSDTALPIRESGSAYQRPQSIPRNRPRSRPDFTPSPSNPSPKRPDTPSPFPHIPSRTKTRKKRKLSLPKIPRKFVIIGAVIVVIIGAYMFIAKPKIPQIKNMPGSPSVTTTKIVQKPEYDTILPAGKTIDALGGWKRVSPPGKDPVFAYADKIGIVGINVSQQPLPDSFKHDTAGAIEKLAKGYAADEKVKVDTTTAYVGTSSEGSQSVILTKSDLLILIKSTGKLTSDQWAHYINSLQ